MVNRLARTHRFRLRRRLRSIDEKLAYVNLHLSEVRRMNRYDASQVRAGRLDYDKAEIYLRLGSFREFQRLGSCASEPWTVEWIEKWVEQDDVVYDLGANIGAYSLVAAKGAGARVYAFEPVYSTYAALVDNVALNGLEGRVVPLPIAVADTSGLASISLSDTAAGAAMHAMGERALEGGGAPVLRQPVLSFTLDEAVERFQLPAPTHLKLDVDGAENLVLAGAQETLKQPGLRTVLAEIGRGEEEEKARAAIESSGLRMVEHHRRPQREGGDVPVAYGLFVRPDAVA